MSETEEKPEAEVAVAAAAAAATEALPKKDEPKEEAPAASTESEKKMAEVSSSLKQETRNDNLNSGSSKDPENNMKEDTDQVEETAATATSGVTAEAAESTELPHPVEDKASESKITKKKEAARGSSEEKSTEKEDVGTNAAPQKDPAENEGNSNEEQPVEERKDTETATDATADSEGEKQASSGPIVSSSKKNRPPYKYDPKKITLRFLFANRDGLTVTVECNPSDTVGEVKGALISVWPDDLPLCEGGEDLRLICMGKGYLMPDSRTLEDCQIPVFKTHPTPINVSVKPKHEKGHDGKHRKGLKDGGSGNRASSNSASNSGEIGQGCACNIL